MLDFYYPNFKECINYGHSRSVNPEPMDFHLHNRFEIYFFISGSVNYLIEKKIYPLKPGDLLVMNSHEIHKPTFPKNELYERIVIHFEPSIAKFFSPPGFDLLHCFVNRPKGEQNKINLTSSQIDKISTMLRNIEATEENTGSEAPILRLTYFIELLVYINRIFMSAKPSEELYGIPEKLVPILDYIDTNLESDLTLKALAEKFFIDGSYLSRLFKKSIGSNIHEYIIYKRISRAKKLLADGLSVTDACIRSGFNDYSNFLRMFKRTVGVSPGCYKKAALSSGSK